MQAPFFLKSSSPRILETQPVFRPSFPCTPVPHWECGAALGLPEEFLRSPAMLKSCRENDPVELTGVHMQAMGLREAGEVTVGEGIRLSIPLWGPTQLMPVSLSSS